MGRCCDGKNAYRPISRIRYFAGLVIFYLMNINLKVMMSLRYAFIKRYPHYHTLKQFHNLYFHDTLREIKQHKGLVIKSRCTPA